MAIILFVNFSLLRNASLHLYKHTDLSTASDGKFFKRSNIINQQVHKSQLVTESHQDVQSRGVEGYAVTLFLEFLILLQ